MIFLTSLINIQIIDDEFYIINIKNITYKVHTLVDLGSCRVEDS